MLKSKLQAAIVKSWSESHGSDHFHLEVALSGGVDSVVLLHLLVALQEQMNWTVSAVHVNHQLQQDAPKWVAFCQNLCEQWDVPLRIEVVEIVDTAKFGTEAAARHARYQAFAQTSANIVVLAHHSDDQIETALLAFLRGGGVRALAAMPIWRHLDNDIALWRPLLNVSKQQVQEYAGLLGLNHIEDPSNLDEQYTRNWLRQRLIPEIVHYESNIHEKILAGVQQRQQELELIEEIQLADWQCITEDGVVNLHKLMFLSVRRQEQQLLYFSKYHQVGGWNKAKLKNFMVEIGKQPLSRHHIYLGHGEIHIDRARMYGWGALQKNKIKQLFRFFDECLLDEELNFQLALAFSKNFSNTEIQSLRKYRIRLQSLGDLRQVLSPKGLKKTIQILKVAKIPLFVLELWPCWYEVTTNQVWAVGIQDAEIHQQFPLWEEKFAFLNHYLIQVK